MTFSEQIEKAKAGDPNSLGTLLKSYESYLWMLADVQIGRSLQGKVDASDIVQETFLEAHRAITRFQGSEPAQFAAWLRAILSAQIANVMRRFLGTQARNVRLEETICDELNQSSLSLAGMFVDPNSSPSQHAVGVEQSRLIAEAVTQLSPDYRQTIILRHIDGLTFPQIANVMGRSVDSVEKLWLRAITELRKHVAVR
jgi:RNA polymerase sigma-70 factor, ECF subfamily